MVLHFTYLYVYITFMHPRHYLYPDGHTLINILVFMAVYASSPLSEIKKHESAKKRSWLITKIIQETF